MGASSAFFKGGLDMAALLGLLAFVFAALFGAAFTFYVQAKRDGARIQREAMAELDRYKAIRDLEQYKAELDTKLNKARAVLPRFQSLAEMELHKQDLTHSIAALQHADAEWRQHILSRESTLAGLVTQVQAVEETLEMQSFGFYRPKYGFEDSKRYEHELDRIRADQQKLLKEDMATHCSVPWTVDGSAAKGRKMVKEHAKLMLRAFNGECDAALAKVKYNNVNNLENRMNRSFETVNKLGESQQLYVTQEYLKLKLQELYLVHEHREKVEEERQAQREIRERLREEEKALKEIEKAQKDAEREEETKTNALERARQELVKAKGKQVDRLQALVDRLEAELKDALERKAKAIARAQLTRSGHVYVLSNVGSFGEGVYKIGMTRRFEPLERVDELGDASVPFRYDVHAMIYSKDAPSLETKLHKHFESRRVNMVNLRREFFRVTLDEIRDAVERHFGQVTFRTMPEAEEFRKTLAMSEDLAMPGGAPTAATATSSGQSAEVLQAVDLLSLGNQVRPPHAVGSWPTASEAVGETSDPRARRN
jgi:hypothetical protein